MSFTTNFGLEQEVDAQRWASLDRALRDISDDGGGVADLRPRALPDDQELRRLLLGRAAKLERLGLAEQIGSARWMLKPGLEPTLRDLGIRGDIIKTMHRAVSGAGREPNVSGFALHYDDPADPVVGRLIERGLHDELKGTAYAIVEGTDGRTHHLRFSDLDMTGDAKPGAIVEARAWDDSSGRRRLSLATRSDLDIREQVIASGATWLDRQLLAKESAISAGGFGSEVLVAMDQRIDHLVEEGLARRQLAFIWAATEWTAGKLGFQHQLGHPWVPAVRLARLSTAGVLLVVVRLRRLCLRNLRGGRLSRGVEWHRGDRRRRHHVDLARPRGEEGYDLRLSTLG